MTADYWALPGARHRARSAGRSAHRSAGARCSSPRSWRAACGAELLGRARRWCADRSSCFAPTGAAAAAGPARRAPKFLLPGASRCGLADLRRLGWARRALARWARVAVRHRRRALGAGGRVRRLLPRLCVGAHRPRRRAPQPEHPAVRALGDRAVVLGIGVALGRPGATRKAFALAAAALAAVVAACLIKMGSSPTRRTAPLIAFFLPAWVGVTAGLGGFAGLKDTERPDLEVGRLGDADQLGVIAAGAGARQDVRARARRRRARRRRSRPSARA